MMHPSHLPIRFKVLAAPILVLLGLGAVLLLSYRGLERQQALLASIHETSLRRASAAHDLLLSSEKLQSDLFQTAVLSFMKRPEEEIRPLFDRLESRVHALNVRYGEIQAGWSMEEKERRVFLHMRESLGRFREQAGQAAEVIVESPALGMLFVRSALDHFQGFQGELEGFLELQKVRIARTSETSRQSAERIEAAIYGVGSVAFLLCLGVSLWIGTRWIANPVLSLSAGMNRLAQGDLSGPIPGIERKDEIGFMARAVEVFQRNALEKRASEEALLQAEVKLKLAMEAADEGLWEWNLATDEAVFDKVALRMLGYALSDARGPLKRGSWWMTQVHPEDRKEMEAAFRAYVDGATPLYSEEFRIRRKDGGYVWVASTGQAIVRDAGGRPEVMAGIHRDVTDRKQRESRLETHREALEQEVEKRTRALQEAQEQLIRREKLAALGQVLGGLGHELKNSLGAVKNAAFFLRMIGEGGDEDARDALAVLDREVSEAEKILQSLFDYAAPKDPALGTEVDLNALIRETLSRSPLPQKLEVSTRLDEGLPWVKGDGEQLEQVLGNLVRNAVQAMPEGGCLAVSTKTLPPGRVEVRVSDTGTGIPRENLARVFEPLFTTKAQGIGLGLALSKGHVERHGGSIRVESEEGRGTTFTVRLPVSGPEPAAPGEDFGRNRPEEPHG